MERQRGELVPIAEALADLPGPVKALRRDRPPQRGFTLADQIDRLVGASEANATARTWTPGPFCYQAKLRKGMPGYLREWLRGIVAAGERKGSIGVVIWKQPRERDDEAVVLLRLRDWQDLHGN